MLSTCGCCLPSILEKLLRPNSAGAVTLPEAAPPPPYALGPGVIGHEIATVWVSMGTWGCLATVSMSSDIREES